MTKRAKTRPLPSSPVDERIVLVRGEKVILDVELAEVYGVETRVLNQAVKRNVKRFPRDFAFRLSRDEIDEIQRSRSQSVILKRGQNLKYPPWAFTEHGALMAASVLNSPRAIQMSVFVVRAFVRLRDLARTHAMLAAQLAALERRVAQHDEGLKQLFAALRSLLQPPATSHRSIGFRGTGV